MRLFIHQLPISEEQKDALRNHERKYFRMYGGLIFLVAVAGKAADLNRHLLAGLILALFAGASIQLVTGSSRDVITKVFIGLFLLFMALQYFFGINIALNAIFPPVACAFLFASWRGRRDYVLSCSNGSTT